MQRQRFNLCGLSLTLWFEKAGSVATTVNFILCNYEKEGCVALDVNDLQRFYVFWMKLCGLFLEIRSDHKRVESKYKAGGHERNGNDEEKEEREERHEYGMFPASHPATGTSAAWSQRQAMTFWKTSLDLAAALKATVPTKLRKSVEGLLDDAKAELALAQQIMLGQVSAQYIESRTEIQKVVFSSKWNAILAFALGKASAEEKRHLTALQVQFNSLTGAKGSTRPVAT
jgi:hypothetical protein